MFLMYGDVGPIRAMRSRDFNAEDLKRVAKASEKLSTLPIIIDDYSSTSLARIRSQCLRYKI